VSQIPFSQLFWSLPVLGSLYFLARELLSSIHDGEIHVVMSARWEGIWGEVKRLDRPILFWSVVSTYAACYVLITALFLRLIWS
jgi:hypothetical protein